MTNLPPDQPSSVPTSETNASYVPPTPLRCLVGATISGALATALYSLTLSIIQAFAHKPLPSGSSLSANIAVAVRTLVVGLSTLATAIFAIVTLGLMALGVQLLIQQWRKSGS